MSRRVPVLIQRLDPDLPLPSYARPGDAGADLVARHDVLLGPGERALVATGVAIALPDGYAAFVHPRSGLAAKHGVTTLNGPGTVDAGYRGEIQVNLVNLDPALPFQAVSYTHLDVYKRQSQLGTLGRRVLRAGGASSTAASDPGPPSGCLLNTSRCV